MTRLDTTTAMSSTIWMRARSAAENVADFEILQQLARDGRRDADDSRYAENGDDAGSSRNAERHHQQRRDDQRWKA